MRLHKCITFLTQLGCYTLKNIKFVNRTLKVNFRWWRFIRNYNWYSCCCCYLTSFSKFLSGFSIFLWSTYVNISILVTMFYQSNIHTYLFNSSLNNSRMLFFFSFSFFFYKHVHMPIISSTITYVHSIVIIRIKWTANFSKQMQNY